jgi:anti-sigma B factor antagonist
MELTELKREKALLVNVKGRLDSASSGTFEGKLVGLISGGERAIILDCAGLDYLSSAGLRALLVAAKKMQSAAGKLVVSSLKDEVREVFEISGFSTVFPLFATVAEAEASL